MHLRRPQTSHPTVRPGLMALAACSALLLSGCSEFSPQTTQLQYAPSDGSQIDLGDLGVRNALFIVGDGATASSPANFVGVLVNEGTEPLTVELGTGSETTSIPVQAGQAVQVGPESDTSWQVAAVGAVPGRTVTVSVSTGPEQGQLAVTVLDGSLVEYSTLAPDGAGNTATQSPAETQSPTGTESPAATAN